MDSKQGARPHAPHCSSAYYESTPDFVDPTVELCFNYCSFVFLLSFVVCSHVAQVILELCNQR